MPKQATFFSVLVMALTALATPALAHEEGIAEVETVDIAFMPSAVAIEPGHTVVWNHPQTTDAHNVKFDTPFFESPADPSPLPWSAATSFAAAGEYRYYCEEHVGEGMSGTVFVNASGTLPEGAPTASFTVSENPGIGQPVTFNAAASSDPTPGESVVKYDWDLDGNGAYETPTANRPTVTGTYNTAGSRTVGLRVTDTRGLTGETTRQFSVAGSPEPPPPPSVASPSPPAAGPAVQPPAIVGPIQPVVLPPVSSKIRLLSSKRLKNVLRRGLRFEAGVPSNGAGLRVTLSVRGRTLGTLRRTSLSRGRVRLTIKLSRRGKTNLKKLLARRRRVATVIKVTAGNTTSRARVTLSR